MGKKGKKSKVTNKINNHLPYVSICTPTFNRRPFFKGIIECISQQDYPRNKMEWIVLDDGTDCIRDIIESDECKKKLDGIKIIYNYEKEKMDLGKKRNAMHKNCTFKGLNDIIVYMDDDDYYPPQRVSHSVNRLISKKEVLAGGASELYLWFNTLNKMYKFGPYGPNHATAGTFAFKRQLLLETSYEDEAVLAEEKHFLKNYTVPFIQFDPMKTILVVSHEQNTFDKRRLLNKENKYCQESSLKVNNFIKDKKLCKFYDIDINELLKDYDAGDVKNKPKVLKEIARRDNERKELHENRPSGIHVTDQNNQSKELTIKEVKQYMEHKTKEVAFLKNKLKELMSENRPSGITMVDQNNNSKELTLKEIKEFMEHKSNQCIMLMNKNKELTKLLENNNIVIESSNNFIDNKQSDDDDDNNDDCIKMIMDQTNCSKEKAIETFKLCNNDVVESILKITESN